MNFVVQSDIMMNPLLLSLTTSAIFYASPMQLNYSAIPFSKDCIAELQREPETATFKMWVEDRTTFYKGETIELHFRMPHAQYLGVMDPSGHFFYLVYPSEDAQGDLHPVVTSADFMQMTDFKIVTNWCFADPYTYGVSQNKPVFTQSGKYIFILGENLHVDDPNELERVEIDYLHQNRPAQSQPGLAVN